MGKDNDERNMSRSAKIFIGIAFVVYVVMYYLTRLGYF